MVIYGFFKISQAVKYVDEIAIAFSYSWIVLKVGNFAISVSSCVCRGLRASFL